MQPIIGADYLHNSEVTLQHCLILILLPLFLLKMAFDVWEKNVNHVMALGKRGHAGLMLIFGYALINQQLTFGCHLLVVIVIFFKPEQHGHL